MRLSLVLRSRLAVLLIVAVGLVAASAAPAASGAHLVSARELVSDPDLLVHPCPAAGLPPDQVVATQRFAPGWNLVGGPFGSCLYGAIDPFYGPYVDYVNGDGDHIQDYQRSPADYPLLDGTGYWAYFPAGGRIELTTGGVLGLLARQSPAGGPLPTGTWQLLGNPSPDAAASVDGAAAILTYTPTTGYQPVDAIPPGQGAWVLGGESGMVHLHAASATDSGRSLPPPHPVADDCSYPGAVPGVHHTAPTDDQERIGRTIALADTRVLQVAQEQTFTSVRVGIASLLDPTCDADVLLGVEVDVTWAQPSPLAAGTEWPATIGLAPGAAKYLDRPYLDATKRQRGANVCALSIVVDTERQRVIDLHVSPLNSDVCAHRIGATVAWPAFASTGTRASAMNGGVPPRTARALAYDFPQS